MDEVRQLAEFSLRQASIDFICSSRVQPRRLLPGPEACLLVSWLVVSRNFCSEDYYGPHRKASLPFVACHA